MTVKQAREAARQWMVEEASGIPGFCGAYTAGSTNWLPDDADLTTASDLDIMVVLADQNQAGRRCKFIYHDTLLEVSYLRNDQLQAPDQVLSDYHLAPSFRTTKVMFDPLGHLTPLLAAVSRDYSKRQWVRRRCANAPKNGQAAGLFGCRGRRIRHIGPVRVARRGFAAKIRKGNDPFAGKIRMDDDQPVLFEIAEQAAGATGRMRAVGARNHRVRRTRQAADGRLRHHQEHGLKILGHTIGKLQRRVQLQAKEIEVLKTALAVLVKVLEESNVVDAVIRSLRKKLCSQASVLETVIGIGYRLRTP